MRLLLASVAALAAVAFAAPSFAQEEPAATPTPAAKPKPGTAAYCNTLKSTTSKNACLKRVQAAAKKSPTGTTTASKSKAKKLNPPADTSAQLSQPTSPPAAPSAPSSSAPTQNVAVPPLPQKTI